MQVTVNCVLQEFTPFSFGSVAYCHCSASIKSLCKWSLSQKCNRIISVMLTCSQKKPEAHKMLKMALDNIQLLSFFKCTDSCQRARDASVVFGVGCCDSVSLEAEMTLLARTATGHRGQFHIMCIWSTVRVLRVLKCTFSVYFYRYVSLWSASSQRSKAKVGGSLKA